MNGIPILDSIPVNWFILGVSILAGVILFLILTQIPDDDEDDKKDSNDLKDSDPEMLVEEEEVATVENKPKAKRSKSRPKKRPTKR